MADSWQKSLVKRVMFYINESVQRLPVVQVKYPLSPAIVPVNVVVLDKRTGQPGSVATFSPDGLAGIHPATRNKIPQYLA